MRLTSDTPATAPADELATEWPCYFGQLQLTSRELVDEREGLRLVRHDASDVKGNRKNTRMSGEVCRSNVAR